MLGSASNPDQLETQLWAAEPEAYINDWLANERAEHAARVEAAQTKAAAEAQAAAREEAESKKREEAKDREVRQQRLNRTKSMLEAEEQEKPATRHNLNSSGMSSSFACLVRHVYRTYHTGLQIHKHVGE